MGQPPPAAVAGGAIALGQPTLGAEELAAVADVFTSGWVAGKGPVGEAFEGELATAVGTTHALAVSNCTAALHVALLVHGVGQGDEVIVADYTFPATGHAVLYTGAKPVFADVHADTATVDPGAVAALIGPRTAGVIAVDVAGLPADYEELRALADRHKLFLIADAACSLGATYWGRPAGSLSPIGCFSFQGRKVITAGEGGALVTDDEVVWARARSIHAFGVESALHRAAVAELRVPRFIELGYNYKMSEVAAAILRVQLRRLPEFLAARRRVADRYSEILADLELVTLPRIPSDRSHSWQSYILTLASGVNRDAVATALRAQSVECTIGTYASHLQPVYGDTHACPVSADLFARHLAIPMHANLTESQVERVAAAVREAVEKACAR